MIASQPSGHGRSGLNIRYIERQDQLDAIVSHLGGAGDIYFDMEVDNMHHYYTQVCLLQVRLGEECCLIDPLAGIDLNRFLDMLASRTIVLHGSDFDLRMLWQRYRFVPARIFDTMLAAQLAGEASFGLGALVERHFGHRLDKNQQTADWSRRPLDSEMVRYAAMDIQHLGALKDLLTRRLEASGRLDWHREWCERALGDAEQAQSPSSVDAWRIRGSNTLAPRQLAALRALWNWREARGAALNKPTYKVFNSQAILALCARLPPDEKGYWKPGKLPIKVASGLRDEVRLELEGSVNSPRQEWPAKSPANTRKRWNVDAQRVEALKAARDRVAESLGLPPSLLASRNALVSLAGQSAMDAPASPPPAPLMRWQWDQLKEVLTDVLQSGAGGGRGA